MFSNLFPHDVGLHVIYKYFGCSMKFHSWSLGQKSGRFLVAPSTARQSTQLELYMVEFVSIFPYGVWMTAP